MKRLAIVALLAAAGPAAAQPFIVDNNADTNATGTLRWAIGQANTATGAATININTGVGVITLGGELPILTNVAGITINGNGNTLDGNSGSTTTGFRGLFIGVGTGEAAAATGVGSLLATTAATWSVNNLTIQNANARGGNSQDGGGGAGLGGGFSSTPAR